MRFTGGLLVDFGVLTLKTDALPSSFYPHTSSTIPRLPPSHPAIIEWRAMTVIELCVQAYLFPCLINFRHTGIESRQPSEPRSPTHLSHYRKYWKALHGKEDVRSHKSCAVGAEVDLQSKSRAMERSFEMNIRVCINVVDSGPRKSQNDTTY